MKTLNLAVAAAVALAITPAPSSAQIQASGSFTIDLPIVLPRLVLVQPGIQVVPDLDVEVFQVDGFYWTQRDGRWYRSKSHRGGWVYVDRGVPPGLVRMPPGKYKRWKPAPPPHAFGGDRRERRDFDGHDKQKGGKKHGRKD